jgi:hypothetical protein
MDSAVLILSILLLFLRFKYNLLLSSEHPTQRNGEWYLMLC